MAEETSRTQEVITSILNSEAPQHFARITTGAGLGALKVLQDIEGLEQARDYCNIYLKEIQLERQDPH